MAKRRRSYQKRSPEQWKQLVADQRSSGQSVRGFARSRGIRESSLGHWSRRLRYEDDAGLGEAGSASSLTELRSGGLVELVAQLPQLNVDTSIDGVRLLVGSSVCLELSELPRPEYLALVASTYEAVGS